MKKLAIVSSHPIQYNAPWFRLLSQQGFLQVKVFYTWSQAQQENKFDPGFNREIKWDIPLLEGYDYCFVNNTSTAPGSHHFKGIVNPTLQAEIAAWQPDLLLVFGWAFSSHLKCIRHFHGKIPVLFRGDSTLLDETKGIKVFLRRLFLKWVYRHVDVALYTGINNKKYFEVHGLKPEQLIPAPHAVDNDRFADTGGRYSTEARQMRLQFGFSDNDIVLLFAGKFESKKNPFLLVELLRHTRALPVKVLFTGNGQLEAALKAAVKDDQRFVFTGFKNQQVMPVMYRVADIFVLPSKGPGETWGLAVNEAMASGKPVVVSDKVGGAVDLVQDDNGIIISNNNMQPFINLLQQAVNNRQLLVNMGARSAERVKAFSFMNIIDAFRPFAK